MLRKVVIQTLVISTCILFSQSKRDIEYSGFFDSYYFRGPVNFILGGGTSAYSGDLKKTSPSYIFGGGATYRVWPRTYFGAQFNYLSFKAGDADTTRNISFNNKMTEFYVYGRFNIFERKMLKNMDVNRKEMFFRPYITLGLGTNRYSVSSTTTNPKWSLDSIPENAKYPRFGVFVPMGLGTAFRITHRVSILAEFNYRFPFTDYLDQVSARGNTRKDKYYSFELKVQYSPFAPRVRRKKLKYGNEPSYIGGGKAMPQDTTPVQNDSIPIQNNDVAPNGTDDPNKPNDAPPLEDNQQKEIDKPKEDDPWAEPPK